MGNMTQISILKIYLETYLIDPVSATAAEFANRNPIAITVFFPNPEVACATSTICPIDIMSDEMKIIKKNPRGSWTWRKSLEMQDRATKT
jgi:hypothetical protein